MPSPNEESIALWSEILVPKFKRFRHVFVAAAASHSTPMLVAHEVIERLGVEIADRPQKPAVSRRRGERAERIVERVAILRTQRAERDARPVGERERTRRRGRRRHDAMQYDYAPTFFNASRRLSPLNSG